jgi:hypothetical protein
MELKELYEQYGQLMIQAEVFNARINEVKRLIAEELNKSNKPVEVKNEATQTA